MKIEHKTPPNYEDIIRVFPRVITNKNTVFCYGDTIYAPFCKEIAGHIVAHESVHSFFQARIGGGPEAWWEEYLGDVDFRYEQELVAHKAEYAHLIQNAPSRNVRRSALNDVARKLSAPLYGKMIIASGAKRAIREMQ